MCALCDKGATQACSCCPRGLCEQHQITEALNQHAPVFVGDCAMYICLICQDRPARMMASHMHHKIIGQFNMMPQELYTASGDRVSMYVPKTVEPPLSAREFSTRCYLEDFRAFTEQVPWC